MKDNAKVKREFGMARRLLVKVLVLSVALACSSCLGFQRSSRYSSHSHRSNLSKHPIPIPLTSTPASTSSSLLPSFSSSFLIQQRRWSDGLQLPYSSSLFPFTATPTLLKGSNNNNDDDDDAQRRRNRSSGERNDARLDVRNLLTQRAIQSFLFLLETVRDPHSIRWIETFLQTKNQLTYHGTGAGYMDRFGDGSWDAPLRAMLEQPKDVVTFKMKVSGKRGGSQGWSVNNPHVVDRFREFDIDIDPVSLTGRILSVREQIAEEWKNDLDLIQEANGQILESYFNLSKIEQGNVDDMNQEGTDGNYDVADFSSSSSSASLSSPAPTSKNEKRKRAFERTAPALVQQAAFNQAKDTSPFRKGNFDLLHNLCTQSAVHQVLRQLQEAGEAKEVSFCWLREFYSSRVANFFDGDQPYGRADDFIEELLLSSPSFLLYNKTNTGNNSIRRENEAGLADPLRLAEQIIDKRQQLVEEWKELMREVPRDHVNGIRKVLLAKQMAAWSSPAATETSAEETGDERPSIAPPSPSPHDEEESIFE